MKRRLLVAAAVLVAASVAIAAGMAATAPTWAQANLAKYRAVPKFVAPGPAFDAKARQVGRRCS